jgi:2-polyprenyl-6-methoxyphenol hydroxylase-like FAD-dependent oxidoreductase
VRGEGLHVLVIGAGLSGLCLAQGLAGAEVGVSVAVYERDASPGFRSQGYRITLKHHGARALRDCLPPHLFELCAATALKGATKLVVTDEQLRPRFQRPIRHAEPGGAGFSVNRLTLREILLAGLDGVVRFGATLERFESAPAGADGPVRACFADGATAAGDLLAGADGTWSAVRRQLLPGATVDELGWVIYGRTPVTGELLDQTPAVLVDTFNRVTGPDGVTVSIATCRPREPAAQAAARLAPGVRLTDIPGYFSWTMPLRDSRRRDADPATLHQAAIETVAGFHPAVRRVIEHADVPATFALCVTSARPVTPWRSLAVTLLGDAIHTMSPGRGDGANIALKDAALLASELRGAAAGRVSVAAAKAAYETAMLDYGFRAVADSLHRPFAPPRSA